jgi:hypothetical protein
VLSWACAPIPAHHDHARMLQAQGAAAPVERSEAAGKQHRTRWGASYFPNIVSIDPENDTPEVLAEYAERFRIGPGWLFPTGDEAEILHLRKKLGLYVAGLAELKDHNMSLLIGNQSTGRWMKRSPMDSRTSSPSRSEPG